MPKTTVEIEWDTPDDENWLDPYHIALALRAYCRTTRFVVRSVDAINHPDGVLILTAEKIE